MRFWRSPVGTSLLVCLLGVGVVLGVTGVQVYRGTSPGRTSSAPVDFEAMRIRVEQVRFPAADRVDLSGWLMEGRPELPPILLCHDAGSSRASLLNTAIALRKTGFTVLLFDFRGHGESGGRRSTLGLHEKRDVLGAIDFLEALPSREWKQFGVYGVGMGAHAAVLAAADRPGLKVLVLDGLYPDVTYRLSREVYRGWDFAVDHLSFLPQTLFAVMHGTSPGNERAADAIERLLGRNLLFLAPAGDTVLSSEIQRMYESVPAQADADGNLVILPSTQSDGLFGEQIGPYHQRVSDFFVSRFGVVLS